MKKISVLLIVLLSMFLMVGCQASNNDETTQSENTNSNQTTEEIDYSQFPYESYLSTENPIVTITIENYGEIVLQLFPNVAENTVNNFIKYIQDGDYSNSTFHRVIEDFMIQGGIVSQPNCAIKGEFSTNNVANDLNHYRGVISMARTGYVNSATSQFFIMHKTSPHLDGSYAAFGGMISGFDVLDAIATVNTNSSDAPKSSVVIKSITVDLNGYVVSDVVCE